MTFLLAPNRKINILYCKLYVHINFSACPTRATIIYWSFKILAESHFYLPRPIRQVLM